MWYCGFQRFDNNDNTVICKFGIIFDLIMKLLGFITIQFIGDIKSKSLIIDINKSTIWSPATNLYHIAVLLKYQIFIKLHFRTNAILTFVSNNVEDWNYSKQATLSSNIESTRYSIKLLKRWKNDFTAVCPQRFHFNNLYPMKKKKNDSYDPPSKNSSEESEEEEKSGETLFNNRCRTRTAPSIFISQIKSSQCEEGLSSLDYQPSQNENSSSASY